MLSSKVYAIGENRTMTLNYTDDGPKCVLKDTKTGSEISVLFSWKRRVCFRYPKSCTDCPVGFNCREDHDEPCGRNVPWTDIDSIQRPPACKLKLFDITPLIDML